MLVLYSDVRVSDGKHIFQEVLITIYLFAKYYAAHQAS